MKLASFLAEGEPSYDIVDGCGLVELERQLRFPDLKAVLEHADSIDPSLAQAKADYAQGVDIAPLVGMSRPAHVAETLKAQDVMLGPR